MIRRLETEFSAPPVEKRPSRFGLFQARCQYVLWLLLTKLPCGVICFFVTSEGLRLTVAPLGQKLCRLPGLSALRDYEATYQLDLACCLAPLLITGVYYCWDQVLRLRLGIQASHQSDWNSANYRRIVSVLAVVLLGSDAALFYTALAEMGWHGSQFSFGALLASVAYCGVLLFVSLVSISLQEKIARNGD